MISDLTEPPRPLDPYTLRALARQMDAKLEEARGKCDCIGHHMMAQIYEGLAAEFRTQALRVVPARSRGEATCITCGQGVTSDESHCCPGPRVVRLRIVGKDGA